MSCQQPAYTTGGAYNNNNGAAGCPTCGLPYAGGPYTTTGNGCQYAPPQPTTSVAYAPMPPQQPQYVNTGGPVVYAPAPQQQQQCGGATTVGGGVYATTGYAVPQPGPYIGGPGPVYYNGQGQGQGGCVPSSSQQGSGNDLGNGNGRRGGRSGGGKGGNNECGIIYEICQICGLLKKVLT